MKPFWVLFKLYLFYGVPIFSPSKSISHKLHYFHPACLLILNFTAVGFALSRAAKSESATSVIQNIGLVWFLVSMLVVYALTAFDFRL
jgi:hypothetical protein